MVNLQSRVASRKIVNYSLVVGQMVKRGLTSTLALKANLKITPFHVNRLVLDAVTTSRSSRLAQIRMT